MSIKIVKIVTKLHSPASKFFYSSLFDSVNRKMDFSCICILVKFDHNVTRIYQLMGKYWQVIDTISMVG